MSDQQDYPDVDDGLAGGQEIPDPEAEFARGIADQVRAELQNELDPYTAAEAAQQAELGALAEQGAREVVLAHEWAGDEAGAMHLVTEARRAAVELGDPSLAGQPAFWGRVAAALERGGGGPGIGARVEAQSMRDAIVHGHARGAGALPFGPDAHWETEKKES
jgi:hypothetical protein